LESLIHISARRVTIVSLSPLGECRDGMMNQTAARAGEDEMQERRRTRGRYGKYKNLIGILEERRPPGRARHR
jgi:hypothetical protein